MILLNLKMVDQQQTKLIESQAIFLERIADLINVIRKSTETLDLAFVKITNIIAKLDYIEKRLDELYRLYHLLAQEKVH
jgi:hypothetical protein